MFYDNKDAPYTEHKIHPEDRRTLEDLTSPPHWDATRFKKVITSLGVLGGKASIPAPNRPDSIDLTGWQTWFEVTTDLVQRSKDGNEHARAIFADPIKLVPFFSDKISVGKGLTGTVNFTPPASRPRAERVGSLHVHPAMTMTRHGLSSVDYGTFLTDSKQQFMGVVYDSWTIMALKTSATPNNWQREEIKREVAHLYQEAFQPNTSPSLDQIVNFNKAVCTNFGLTFYNTDRLNSKKINRVEVTH